MKHFYAIFSKIIDSLTADWRGGLQREVTLWSALSDLCRLGNYLQSIGHDQAAFTIDDQRQPVFPEFFNNGSGWQTELIWIYKFAQECSCKKETIKRGLNLFCPPSVQKLFENTIYRDCG